MKMLQVLGFFIIFWQFSTSSFQFTGISLFSSLSALERYNALHNLMYTRMYMRLKCKQLEDTALLRLKRQLLCNYDSSIHPNHLKNNVTVVTLRLMPKLMELEDDHAILSLHSWITLTWSDPQLVWTPSDYDGINFINVKSWEIWTPNLYVYNSGDMSENQLELPEMKCLFFSEGFVSCVPAVKFVAKCDPDYTYFPYEKYQCRITFGSWTHTGIEVDYQLDRDGITMDGYENNAMWDLKFINAVKEMKTHKCCSNDTFPTIDYNFLLTRYHRTYHITNTVPAIALIFLTLTVLCLDVKSMERIALANVNFVCHLLCLYNMYWQLPYNGINIPKILIFYGESVVLTALTIVLTVLLRKLEDMNTKMPNWISSMTMFVLSNSTSRFLILKDNEIKIVDENIVIEENLNVSKSETEMKEPSWKHFVTIIDWLSFIGVILTYIIMIIIIVPIS